MTNNIKGLDFNGVKVKFDGNTKLIHVKGNSINGTITVTNAVDGTQYQVPVGKKATIVYIVTLADLGGADLMRYCDDLDGTTNPVNLLVAPQTANTIVISDEIPATKYLNYTNNNINAYDFYLIEENA